MILVPLSDRQLSLFNDGGGYLAGFDRSFHLVRWLNAKIFSIIFEDLAQTIKLIITAPSCDALAQNFAVFLWDLDWKWRQSLKIANAIVNALLVDDLLIEDECLKNGATFSLDDRVNQ